MSGVRQSKGKYADLPADSDLSGTCGNNADDFPGEQIFKKPAVSAEAFMVGIYLLVYYRICGDLSDRGIYRKIIPVISADYKFSTDNACDSDSMETDYSNRFPEHQRGQRFQKQNLYEILQRLCLSYDSSRNGQHCESSGTSAHLAEKIQYLSPDNLFQGRSAV